VSDWVKTSWKRENFPDENEKTARDHEMRDEGLTRDQRAASQSSLRCHYGVGPVDSEDGCSGI
jgi:hypothetical protein